MSILYCKDPLGASTEYLSLDDIVPLYPVVNHNQYTSIKESIQREGMLYPVVVWSTIGKYWRKQVRFTDPATINYPTDCVDDFDSVMLVMCGNNRYQAAKDLGYTAIQCILTTSREEVNKLCGIMREHWREAQK